MPAELAVDIIDVAFLVAGALESVGAEYFIGGSLASSLDQAFLSAWAERLGVAGLLSKATSFRS